MASAYTPDEVALLREALAFIGDLDSDDDGFSSPSADGDVDANDGILRTLFAEPLESDTVETTPPEATEENTVLPSLPVPATVAASAIAKKRRIRDNTKRRKELAYLHETVGDLEAKLTEIKQQINEQRFEKLVANRGTNDSTRLVQAAWGQVAMRQVEQRERAEMENMTLKRLLEDQIQVGKSLERLLQHKRPKLEDTPSSGRGETCTRLDNVSTSWDITQLFQGLFASSENQYTDTPRVLSKVLALVRDMANHRQVELVRDEELGMVLQTTESRLLPFEYELVTQEFWHSSAKVSSATVSDYEDVDSSDDLVQARFRANASFGPVRGDFTVTSVDRRFRERHRTVFITSALFDPTEISDMNMDGVCMHHKDWIVFESVHTESGRTATKMMSYSVTVPHAFQGLDDQTRKVGTLTTFVMSAMVIELESRQQSFENRLFDRSVS